MNGIININKPKGFTSHDVVARLRRILSTKKVGHTGTLDPDAVGVLPICVGHATKAAELLTAAEKQYIAEVTLGAETDTQDASGKILRTAPVQVTEADVLRTAEEFVGEIAQIPPMYSAIKQGGKKLYELARAGVEVERKPRLIRIERIEILDFIPEEKKFTMRVDCSKGTYIRTLCRDMGERLGCFGHMSALCRTRSGRFVLEDAVTLEQVEEAVKQADYRFLHPVDSVFTEFPALYLSERKAEKMCNGIRISTPGMTDGMTYRIYDEQGVFLSIAKAEDGVLKLLKTFYGG